MDKELIVGEERRRKARGKVRKRHMRENEGNIIYCEKSTFLRLLEAVRRQNSRW